MKKFIKNNIKVVIAFIIGGFIFGGSNLVRAAISASQVTYTKNSQSTVQGALDTLYTRANSWANPSYFTTLGLNMSSMQKNARKTMIASKSGILFKRSNGTVHYLKANYWAYEKDHIQKIFSDISCYVDPSYVICSASDYYCDVKSDGRALCRDTSDNSVCSVSGSGSVVCGT